MVKPSGLISVSRLISGLLCMLVLGSGRCGCLQQNSSTTVVFIPLCVSPLSRHYMAEHLSCLVLSPNQLLVLNRMNRWLNMLLLTS
jgi:hypothetical protein